MHLENTCVLCDCFFMSSRQKSVTVTCAVLYLSPEELCNTEEDTDLPQRVLL